MSIIVNLLVLVGFLGIASAWISTVFIGHMLYYEFAQRYPEFVEREIPFAKSHIAHPKKFLFLLSSEFRELIKEDKRLFKIRSALIKVLILSVAFPIFVFSLLFAAAIIL